MLENIKLIKEKYGKSLIFNENLSKYNWFNLGGPAEIFFRPKDEENLINFLKETHNLKKKVNILGAGSNTLIRDGGLGGITIKLSSGFSDTKYINGNKIEVGAATLDKKIANFAMENSLSGFEFLSCIPGSIGGSIKMNSGCYGHDISQILESVTVLNLKGEKKIIEKNNINFFYRGCDLNEELIIISAVLVGKKTDIKLIQTKQDNFINKKKNTQPSNVKTCGSTFKNPKNAKAWSLIKNSECQDLNCGDAVISSKHSNFFVNKGNAKARDIENLVNLVRNKVLKKTGINLSLEIKIIGNEK